VYKLQRAGAVKLDNNKLQATGIIAELTYIYTIKKQNHKEIYGKNKTKKLWYETSHLSTLNPICRNKN